MKYTQHKLTTAQLERLSQIVNQRANKFGTAMQALESKWPALVKRKADFSSLRYGKDCFFDATPEGAGALRIARSEGW